ncbi:MAG: nicotinate (nicotinamide) nucleotide adenylyltransferase [Chloroflexi bacterium]|nr:nicotinate (nicotinamide) nucleotide adenylyltransferase [Chloroflexota bacterium]
MPRYGLFGGTFDPPHFGHLILAAEAHHQLQLDQVWWLLTPQPPHKRGQRITPLGMRAQLVSAAIGQDPAFALSLIEAERPGPHYAIDTVRILKRRYPNDTLVYLMGGDSLATLPSWHQAQAFVQEVDEIGVMRRPYDRIDWVALEQVLPGLRAKIRLIEAPLLEIAAHELRARIAQGRPYRYYMPKAVVALIESHGLYREPDETAP